MASPSWQMTGEYFETCSCDYICPCIATNMAGAPTKGFCNFAMVFRIDNGKSDSVKLDGLSFAVIGRAPDVMGKGDWSVGLIVDDKATSEQQQALTAIATGQAGGPPAILTAVVGKFLGVERGPIRYESNGLRRSVSVSKLLEQSCEGIPSAADASKPLYIDNTMHPANTRLALARATNSHLHALGIDWDDTSGKNNGHFAPFNWRA